MITIRKWCGLLLMAGWALLNVNAVDTAVLRDYKSGEPIAYGGKQQAGAVKVPVTYLPKKQEFRGAWVATVENIDFGKHTSAGTFKNEYIQVVNNLQKLNFNAVIFQIRPMNDAFYPSRLNPWSRWLTGKEGQGIGDFDPLSFMISEAHVRGLEFHAWLNPYRVVNSTPLRKQQYLNTLAPGNFARKRPDLVLEIPLADNKYQLILNPGEPAVINFVLNTVKEIMQKYPVDAIHFDDYFYPYTEIKNVDAATYKKYNRQPARGIENWRRDNVNTLIYQLRKTIDSHNKTYKRKVQFGISPFGIWANKSTNPAGSLTAGSQSYYRQYADTRRWVKQEWIDYIVPQLYWPFGRDVAPYAALADWWAEQVRGTNVRLYIGLGAYQMGGSNEMWQNPDEIAAQLRYNSGRSNIHGAAIFSYKSVARPANDIMRRGVSDVLKKYWNHRVPAPAIPAKY